MQYVVPQFIENESKVIGPISVRQFIILLVAAGLTFLWYQFFSFWIFAVLGVATLTLAGVFAFVKINSQSFHTFALSAIQTAKRPALSVWHHDIEHIRTVTKVSRKDRKDKVKQTKFVPKPEVSESHLAELSLIMDTGGKYSPEDVERLLQEQQAIEPPTPKPKTDNHV
jgi:hypothetical protein